MGKYLKISILLLFVSLVLSACSLFEIRPKISDYIWEIETLSNKKESSLENNMTMNFNDDKEFILKDESNNKKYQGDYRIEKVDSSYKLDLYCKDREEAISGVYGIREYDDKTSIATITIEVEDEILTFIPRSSNK